MNTSTELIIIGGIAVGAYYLLRNAPEIATKVATDTITYVIKPIAEHPLSDNVLFPASSSLQEQFQGLTAGSELEPFVKLITEPQGILPNIGYAAGGISGLIYGGLINWFNPFNVKVAT